MIKISLFVSILLLVGCSDSSNQAEEVSFGFNNSNQKELKNDKITEDEKNKNVMIDGKKEIQIKNEEEIIIKKSNSNSNKKELPINTVIKEIDKDVSANNIKANQEELLVKPITRETSKINTNNYYIVDIYDDYLSIDNKNLIETLNSTKNKYLSLLDQITTQFKTHRKQTYSEFQNYYDEMNNFYIEINTSKKIECVEINEENKNSCENYEKQIENIKIQYNELIDTLNKYIEKLDKDEIIALEKYYAQYKNNIYAVLEKYKENSKENK